MHFVVLLSALVACAAGVPVNSPKPTPEGRVIGGTDAKIEDFPFQLSLQFVEPRKTSHICGAVLIKEIWALTAAHCVEGLSASDLRVRGGSRCHYLFGSSSSVQEVFIHDDYNKTQLWDYDIAVLKLKRRFSQRGGRIQTIPLQDSEPAPGTDVVVTGWGATAHSDSSATLQQAALKLISNEDCNKTYPGALTDRMICATAPAKDAGKGDSGSPLVDTKARKLVGLVSWGAPRNESLLPGVYTNIFSLYEWINSVTSPQSL